MCRLGIYVSIGQYKFLEEFIRAFYLASINDIALEKLGYGRRSHNHGWGFIYIAKRFNNISLSWYKTSLPIMDRDVETILKNTISLDADWIAINIHSRLTLREPIDVLNSHPFYVSIPGKISLWLIHNGSVDKEKISRILGLENIKDLYADSYFLANLIAKNLNSLNNNDIVEVFRSLIDMNITTSALNLGILSIDERTKEISIAILNYMVKDVLDDNNRREYYNIYIANIDSKTFIAGSSTVMWYLTKIAKIAIQPLSNGELVIVKPYENSLEVSSFRLL